MLLLQLFPLRLLVADNLLDLHALGAGALLLGTWWAQVVVGVGDRLLTAGGALPLRLERLVLAVALPPLDLVRASLAQAADRRRENPVW